MRLAFVGFRHNHAVSFYHAAQNHPAFEVVAACEEDPATIEAIRREGKIQLTHEDYVAMLDGVDCDVVGIGDYYARRGEIAIQALRRGKHVMADKPLCTRLDELERIASLAAGNRLCVGCLLDLRGSGAFRTSRTLIRQGAIGQVHTVSFSAQHPLLFGIRPAWYFEPCRHGGTINDIAIHALDAIPWITGRKFAAVVAARAWNARLPQALHFQDAAQVMLSLENGGGVLGDVSYLAPDGCGYAVPQYWRMTFHGEDGVLECRWGDEAVFLAKGDDRSPRSVPCEPAVATAAVDAFLTEVHGESGASPSTGEVLAASRVALLAQQAADQHITHLPL